MLLIYYNLKNCNIKVTISSTIISLFGHLSGKVSSMEITEHLNTYHLCVQAFLSSVDPLIFMSLIVINSYSMIFIYMYRCTHVCMQVCVYIYTHTHLTHLWFPSDSSVSQESKKTSEKERGVFSFPFNYLVPSFYQLEILQRMFECCKISVFLNVQEDLKDVKEIIRVIKEKNEWKKLVHKPLTVPDWHR